MSNLGFDVCLSGVSAVGESLPLSSFPTISNPSASQDSLVFIGCGERSSLLTRVWSGGRGEVTSMLLLAGTWWKPRLRLRTQSLITRFPMPFSVIAPLFGRE